MDIPDQLLTIYTAEIQERDGDYVVEVPKRELELGEIHERRTYRTGLIGQSKQVVAVKLNPVIHPLLRRAKNVLSKSSP